jgi:hypothetical protein
MTSSQDSRCDFGFQMKIHLHSDVRNVVMSASELNKYKPRSPSQHRSTNGMHKLKNFITVEDGSKKSPFFLLEGEEGSSMFP